MPISWMTNRRVPIADEEKGTTSNEEIRHFVPPSSFKIISERIVLCIHTNDHEGKLVARGRIRISSSISPRDMQATAGEEDLVFGRN
jgi:hypothetical protein